MVTDSFLTEVEEEAHAKEIGTETVASKEWPFGVAVYPDSD